jgi:hypothetical protein
MEEKGLEKEKTMELLKNYGQCINRELSSIEKEWKVAKIFFSPDDGKIQLRGLSISSLVEFMKIEQVFLNVPNHIGLSSSGMSRLILSETWDDWEKIARESIASALAFFERLKKLGIKINIPEFQEELKE